MKTRFNTKWISTAALAAFILGTFPASAASSNASQPLVATPAGTNASPEASMAALFGDPVIAKGKGFEIKRSQLDELLTGAKANAAAAGQMLPPDFEVQILNQLIFVQLMQQRATDADRAQGKKDADQQFAAILKRFASEDALAQQLKAVGMTVSELRAKATQEAVARAALKRELNVSVSDAEAQEYYTNHPGDFEVPERAQLDDILLLTMDPTTHAPLTADQQSAKRKLANDLLKRVRSGENFTNLAAQYSEDPNSKDSGGVLPPLSRDQMSPELAAAAFSLTNGQISDVVETSYGFYLLKLVEKMPATKLTLADKIPMRDTTVAEGVKDVLTQQKLAKMAPAYIEKLKKDAGVEIVDPKLKALAATLDAAASNAPAATPGQ